ncbi:hypothetical protein DE146DRAFT_623997, partial [Phaeosphaeria sp. MPI-PUGE-AT-0046c]
AVSTSITLLENVLSATKHLRKAQGLPNDLFYVLVRHEDELDSIKTILKRLKKKDIPNLHTTNLCIELLGMQQILLSLAALLKESNPGSKTKIGRLAHQLPKGSIDEQKLSSIMEELAQVKASILRCILVAENKVIRNMDRQIVADTAKIERIASIPQKQLEQPEDYKELRIAHCKLYLFSSSTLLTTTVDGTVSPTETDLQSLSSSSEDSDSEPDTFVEPDTEVPALDISIRVERIIHNNKARDQSCQVNCPVGDDIWKDLEGRLEIRDNVSKHQATQFNYAIPLASAKVLMGCQGKNMKAVTTPWWKRRGSTRRMYGYDDSSGDN